MRRKRFVLSKAWVVYDWNDWPVASFHFRKNANKFIKEHGGTVWDERGSEYQ